MALWIFARGSSQNLQDSRAVGRSGVGRWALGIGAVLSSLIPHPSSLNGLFRLSVCCLSLVALSWSQPASHSQGKPPARSSSQKHSALSTEASPAAIALLRRALKSSNQVAFSGQQTVSSFDTDQGWTMMTQETHLGHWRNRIVFLNPPSARGRISVSDGVWRRIYLPQTQAIVQSRLNIPPTTEASLEARLARIQQHYRLRLYPQLDMSVGRPAHRLDLMARSGDRPSQRLWVDQATGLILRRESYTTANELLNVSSWRDVRILPIPQSLPAHWKLPAEAKVSRQSPERETFHLAEARKLAGSWATLPSGLGKGFAFESARLVKAKGAPALFCQYSDGLHVISLIQISGQRAVASPEQTRSAQIGSNPARVAVRGSFTVLSWERKKPVASLSLIGEVAETLLLQMARSLQ